MENRIERVDSIPLIIHWLMKMQVHKIIDGIYDSVDLLYPIFSPIPVNESYSDNTTIF